MKRLTTKERREVFWYSVAFLAVLFLIGFVENGAV